MQKLKRQAKHILYSAILSLKLYRLCNNVEKYDRAGQVIVDSIVLLLRVTY